jgi:nitrite reductase/ring-hydroxylating ferredoxin subunit
LHVRLERDAYMEESMERRHFLQVLGGSIVAQACSAPMQPPVILHAVDVKMNTLVALANLKAFVGRDAGGLYAMSSICKHEACDIANGGKILAGPKLQCACHGSEYDANGIVINPPSTTNLDHVALSVNAADGVISVNTTTIVAATTRTMG